MPQFLYQVRPARAGFYGAPTPEESHAVDRHFLYLKQAAAEGTVILAGRTLNEDDAGFGIVIFVAESEREARRFADEDPAVRAGVFRMEFFPYSIALTSPHWPGVSSGSAQAPVQDLEANPGALPRAPGTNRRCR